MDMVPTENGWAYMICVGFTITFTVCMAHANSFGLMFNDFLKENSNSASILTTVNGLTGIMISISSLLVNQGRKWFSFRQMAIFGCCCYTMCWILNAFLTNVYQMFFTVSILNGFGWGLIMSSGYTVFNSYFIRKRVMMMGICMSIVGLGSIVFPFVVEYWLNVYGYRGMMALVGAVTAHSIIGSALFQPIEWHLGSKIKSEINDNEIKAKTESPENHTNIKELETIFELKEQSSPLFTPEDGKYITKNMILDKRHSINTEYEGKNNNIDIINNKKNKRIWETLIDELDLTLFKSFSYINVTLAIGCGMLCDIQFYLLQPLLLFEYGFTQSQVTQCISITSIADLTARILLAVVGKFFDVKSRHLCYIGLACSTIGRFAFIQFDDFLGVAIMTAFLGFFRGLFYVALPLMCAEILPIERFAAANGLAVLCNGILNTLFSPVLGLIRDFTESFVVTFYVIASLCIGVIAPWTYEFFIMKKK